MRLSPLIEAGAEIFGRDAVEAIAFYPLGEGLGNGPDLLDVDAVGMLVVADPLGAATEQGDGATGVAAVRVGQADGDLGQALPQIAFCRWAGLPGRFQDFMRVEWAAGPKQFVGEP